MSEELHRRLRQEELAFFGRVGADVSHEMRNVLSVIGEYAGLLDDLLAQAKRRTVPDPEKLKRLAANTTKQVQKGTEIMQRFSSFSHAAEREATSFDLTALTANTVALAQRRVTLAGCTLEAELPNEAIPLSGSPFTTQHAVFSAIQLMLEVSEARGVITLRLAPEGPAAAIRISAPATAGAADLLSGGVSELSVITDELNGNVETSSTGGTVSLALTIPIE